MKRRRFLVGAAGLAVGGKVAAGRFDIGPVREPMTADAISIESTSTEPEGDAYEAFATLRNEGRYTARVGVRFEPTDSGDERTRETTLEPGTDKVLSVKWDYAYHPSIEPGRVEVEITAVENTEDLSPL